MAATESLEPYRGRDFYVPAFVFKLRGREQQDVQHDVASVTFTDSLTEIESCDLVINNWDPDGQGGGRGWLKYSDSDTFDPWQDMSLDMGYYENGNDTLEPMLSGEIVRVTPDFPASGGSSMSIHCVGLLHRFRTKQIDRDYVKKKDSFVARELVTEIAKEVKEKVAGLRLSIDDKEVDDNLKVEKDIEHLTVKQEYAINFLLRRSREIGYEFVMEEKDPGANPREVVFHYRPANAVTRPVYKLEWGKTLISFQPSFAAANQVNEVIVRAWDPTGKKPLVGRARRSDLLREGVLDPTADFQVRQTPLADRQEIVTDEIVESQDEANELAKRRLRLIAQGLIEGRGKTIGLPKLRAGSKVELGGLGRYDGHYVVTGTTHSLSDSGYTTEFRARKEK
jgi:phage protein D